MKDVDIFGSWLLSFDTEVLSTTWMAIYDKFKAYCNSNVELMKVVRLNEYMVINDSDVCLRRGFNQAYTTESYAEFLEDGDCRPNKWIVESLDRLKKALHKPFTCQFESHHHRTIIERIHNKTFVKPNG